FSHFDINATASLDPNAPALAFSLVDNIRITDPCLGDVEAPTITPPADIIVPATSPAGAVVNLEVTATDNCQNPVSVVCEPQSGSTFPIGLTIVACTAEDAAGNATISGFTFTVKNASEQVTDLIGEVNGLPILPGLKNSLVVKLFATEAALGGGSATAACGTLAAFIAEVSAQAGERQFAQDQADELIEAASRIRTVLGCAPAP
ncbi:MAG: HYR domain-containing protein, partial [Verrucomicrobia bacterium]|nr:HYR domain-containing protein [Verrucomicrobiota bacterium]